MLATTIYFPVLNPFVVFLECRGCFYENLCSFEHIEPKYLRSAISLLLGLRVDEVIKSFSGKMY